MKKPIIRGKYREIFLSVAEAYFPPMEGFKNPGNKGINPDYVSRYFGYAPDDLRLGLKGLLIFLDSIAPVMAGMGFRKFRKMPLEERIRVLETLEKSPNHLVRYLVITGKTIVSMFYFDNPETWEDLDYKEECLKRDGNDISN